MKKSHLSVLAAGIAVVAAVALLSSRPSTRNDESAAASGPAAATVAGVQYEEIGWEALVPEDWDPTAGITQTRNPDALLDSSPEADRLLREMRAAWDNAPTVAAMNGRHVRLPGYVVPLEASAGRMREFLLVPYFGACIHTPPPPANQIIHVKADKPVEGFGSMAAVWVTGTLATERQETGMGASGYQLRLARIENYEPAQR